MRTVKVRNVVLGEGRPKICVPIVGENREEIIEQAERFAQIPADIAEWRADWFAHIFDWEETKQVLRELRAVLKEIPLLFTFRTFKEGGEREAAPEVYAELTKAAAATGYVDMIDVELSAGEEIVCSVIAEAHRHGVKAVVSNHDFQKTPDKREIVARLCKMQELGADLPKIAVMPQSKKDVLTLLAATEEMHTDYADRPIITMSMSGTGLISRLCGEIFGSALTFGAAGKTSAPGQAAVEELDCMLDFIHKNL